jgi:hypothetical protein
MASEQHILDIARVIQLAVAPVFLLNSVGTVLVVLSNRVARIVDRTRILRDQGAVLSGFGHEIVEQELSVLSRRSRLIYIAITLSVICALLVCLVIASAFLGAFVAIDLSSLVVLLFALAMFVFSSGLLVFLREIFLAVAGQRLIARQMKR